MNTTDSVLCHNCELQFKKIIHSDCHSLNNVFKNLNPIFTDSQFGTVINYDGFRYQYKNLGRKRSPSAEKLSLNITKNSLLLLNIFNILKIDINSFIENSLENTSTNPSNETHNLIDFEVMLSELSNAISKLNSNQTDDFFKIRLLDKISFIKFFTKSLLELMDNKTTDYQKWRIDSYKFYQATFTLFRQVLPREFPGKKIIKELKAESIDDIFIIMCFYQYGLLIILLDILKTIKCTMEEAEQYREQLSNFEETKKSDINQLRKLNACIRLRPDQNAELKNVNILPLDDLDKLILATEKLLKNFKYLLKTLNKEREMFVSFISKDSDNNFVTEKTNTHWVPINPENEKDQPQDEKIVYYLENGEQNYPLYSSLGTKKNFYWFDNNSTFNSLYKEFISFLNAFFMTIQNNPNMKHNPKISSELNVIDILSNESYLDLNIIITDKILDEYEDFACRACIHYKKMAETLESARRKYSDPRALTQEQLRGKEFILSHWLNTQNTPVLCLDMGHGKTRTAACALGELCKKVSLEGFILIVAPGNIAKAIGEWQQRLNEYGILQLKEIRGTERTELLKNSELNFMANSAYITTFESFTNDLSKGLYEKNIPSVILYDEVHRLTNSTEIQERAIQMARFNQKVRYKLGITGTPAQNSYKDFYSIYGFFHKPALLEKMKNNEISEQELQEVDHILSEPNQFLFFGDREKIDINKQQVCFVPIKINPYHLKLCKNLKNDFRRIHQTLLYPEQYEETFVNTTISNKLLFVKQLVKEIPSNDKIIIFCTYKEPLKFLENYLKEFNPIIIIGSDAGIEGKNNKSYLEVFKTNPDCKVLLCTTQKLGTGESLECANHLVLLDLWWNPATINQVTHRILRKSQTKRCYVYLPIYVEEEQDETSWLESEKHFYETLQTKVLDINHFLEKINKPEGKISIPNLLYGRSISFVDSEIRDYSVLKNLNNPKRDPYGFSIEQFYLSKKGEIKRK